MYIYFYEQIIKTWFKIANIEIRLDNAYSSNIICISVDFNPSMGQAKVASWRELFWTARCNVATYVTDVSPAVAIEQVQTRALVFCSLGVQITATAWRNNNGTRVFSLNCSLLPLLGFLCGPLRYDNEVVLLKYLSILFAVVRDTIENSRNISRMNLKLNYLFYCISVR